MHNNGDGEENRENDLVWLGFEIWWQSGQVGSEIVRSDLTQLHQIRTPHDLHLNSSLMGNKIEEIYGN